MKRLLFIFWIVIVASTFIYYVPIVQARDGCERTGIVTGTIIFVDYVCDTILYVPRLVFMGLSGPGHGYRSRHARQNYSHGSRSYEKGYDKKGRSGRGRSRR